MVHKAWCSIEDVSYYILEKSKITTTVALIKSLRFALLVYNYKL